MDYNRKDFKINKDFQNFIYKNSSISKEMMKNLPKITKNNLTTNNAYEILKAGRINSVGQNLMAKKQINSVNDKLLKNITLGTNYDQYKKIMKENKNIIQNSIPKKWNKPSVTVLGKLGKLGKTYIDTIERMKIFHGAFFDFLENASKNGWVLPFRVLDMFSLKKLFKLDENEIDQKLETFFDTENHKELFLSLKRIKNNLSKASDDKVDDEYKNLVRGNINQIDLIETTLKSNINSYKLLFNYLFAFLEFLNFSNVELNDARNVEWINHTYYSNQTNKNEKLSKDDAYGLTILHRYNLFNNSLYLYDHENKFFNRNRVNHGFFDTEKYTLKLFVQLLMYCECFSEVLVD